MKRCSKCHIEKDESEFTRNRTRKDGRNHRCKLCERKTIYNPNSKCETCGMGFYAPPSQKERGLGRFCSRKCSAKSRDKRVERKCEICGKEIIIYNYEKEKGLGRFCSTSCEGRWRKGDNAPRWMGDNPIDPVNTGHHRAISMFKIQPCEICGETKHVHRHHKDRNPMNNSRENISFLCAKHHRREHLKDKK